MSQQQVQAQDIVAAEPNGTSTAAATDPSSAPISTEPDASIPLNSFEEGNVSDKVMQTNTNAPSNLDKTPIPTAASLPEPEIITKPVIPAADSSELQQSLQSDLSSSHSGIAAKLNVDSALSAENNDNAVVAAPNPTGNTAADDQASSMAESQQKPIQDSRSSAATEEPTIAASIEPSAHNQEAEPPNSSVSDAAASVAVQAPATGAQPAVLSDTKPLVQEEAPTTTTESDSRPAITTEPEAGNLQQSVNDARQLANQDVEMAPAQPEAPSTVELKKSENDRQADDADVQAPSGKVNKPDQPDDDEQDSASGTLEQKEAASRHPLETSMQSSELTRESSTATDNKEVNNQISTAATTGSVSKPEITASPEFPAAALAGEASESSAPDPSQISRPASSRDERASSSHIAEKRTDKDKTGLLERAQDKEHRLRERERRKEQDRVDRDRERDRERERERMREAERDREMLIARENEEARLIWLSLPGNDHPQYYTDTDSDSCYGAHDTMGVDLTDEEDKDLDPPVPLTQQAYHPAPSHSLSSYNSSLLSPHPWSDDANNDYRAAAGGRRKRNRLSLADASTVEHRSAADASDVVARGALPSTPMISIDEFQVPDSSIRGEASDLTFSNRMERPSGALPFNGPREEYEEDFYSSGSDEDAEWAARERKRRHGNRGGNRGNKLSRSKGARWVRRGKLGGWTEMRMDKEIGDRIRHRVEAMQKGNVRALLNAAPVEDREQLKQLGQGLYSADTPDGALRDARGRLLPSDLSEAARIDAQLGLGTDASVRPTETDDAFAGDHGHLTSTSLAPTLLKPAVTARQLLTSHTLRHTFRNPHIGALGKTALDLIESEVVLGRAVGRCWGSMERGGWDEDPEPKSAQETNGSEEQDGHDDPEDAMDVDPTGSSNTGRRTNGSRTGHEQDDTEALFGSVVDNPALSHLDKLFVTKRGLAIPRLDEMGQPIFVHSDSGPSQPIEGEQKKAADEEASEQVIETTLLPAPEQRSIVLAALECLHDLAADSREYVERLEEVRSRLAAVKRTRAQVWYAVRQWALDKDFPADLSTQSVHHKVHTPAAAGASPRKRK